MDSSNPIVGNEMPVFVSVGEIAKSPRQVTSIVWLQSLDTCDMGGIDAIEHGVATPNEVLLRVHDRKLRAILRRAGVEFGQFEDEIIQGSSEVVANLSSQCAEAHSGERLAWANNIYDAMRRVWVQIESDGVEHCSQR